MPRTLTAILLFAALALPGAVLAGTDEYQGDTTIYAGLPTTVSTPNVLIIIDNSRATLNIAPGAEYLPGSTYPLKAGCTAGVSDPRNGCFLDYYIYTIDNQGDVANQAVLANSTADLENLKRPTTSTGPLTAGTSSTCNGSSDVIRKTLQERGTYSGSGTSEFPNIGAGGVCDTSPKGAVYVLGRYLNYVNSTAPPTPPPPASVPAACQAPNPIVKAHEWKNGSWTSNKFGFFQLKNTAGATHTSPNSEANSPYHGMIGTGSSAVPNPEVAYWDQLPQSPAPANFTQWAKNTTYTRTLDLVVDGKTCAQHIADATTTTTTTTTTTGPNKTQREIVHSALKRAVGAAVGAVNFGAMVYGGNNSGAVVVSDIKSLAADAIDPVTGNPVDCSLSGNATKPYCQFLSAIPGPRKDPAQNPPFTSCGDFFGAGCVSSNTGRPQAEALFDAGYYFGATYQSVTNTARIPDAIKNPCNLNHIILLTNGFTNGDGSPKLAVVGDADGDQYPDESVYGLGSHWLDDVARHLKINYGITTHTVLAFQERDELIENAAFDGGGKFYQAYNEEGLSKALLDLFASIINEASTSFVAPVVPASTTNRTVSSNKVYLGLFRPQETDIWHGNIKKYSIGLTNQLLAANGSPATDLYGEFNPNSISYWSLRADGLISSAKGDINPAGTDPNKAKGDGGQVDAGGAGGVLLKRAQVIAAAVKDQATWTPTLPSGVTWRNIYTLLTPANSAVSSINADLTAVQNRFLPTNANITTATLGVTTDMLKRSLIRYVHGFASNDLELTNSAVARDWVLGDVLHSRPLVFNYSKYTDAQENLCAPDAGGMYNSSIIYVGANDGMLHAFRDCDGSELWAFVPPDQLPHLKNLADPISAGGHPTSVDAPPSAFVHDANADGIIDPNTDKVVLLIGQRRGGGSSNPSDRNQGYYYAIDVTTPTQPVYLWRIGYNAGDARDEFAQTWSQPRLAKLKVSDSQFKVVMFVGAGYDTNEDTRYGDTQSFVCQQGTTYTAGVCADTNLSPTGGSVDGSGSPLTSPGSVHPDNRLAARGRGIYAIEIATMTRGDANSPFAPAVSGGTAGTVYWSYRPSNNDNLDYSFASDLTVLDANGDGYADLIYAGDTGGNLWRFDLSASDKANWSGEILFRSNPGADGSNGRKFFYRPITATVGAPHIYIGTGDREHPLNRAVVDRMYSIIDWKAIYPNNNAIVYPIDESKLEDVTLNVLQKADTDGTTVQEIYKRLYSTPQAPYDLDGNFRYGWYIKLDGADRNSSGDLGEKVLAPATVFNGQVFFSTYQLKTGTTAGCDAGNLGISRLYHLDYKTGEAVFNYDLTNDVSGTDPAPLNERAVGGENGERLQRSDRVRTLGEGIPSGIVTLIDASGKVTILISSSDKVEASGLPDVRLITPVYWMQW